MKGEKHLAQGEYENTRTIKIPDNEDTVTAAADNDDGDVTSFEAMQ